MEMMHPPSWSYSSLDEVGFHVLDMDSDSANFGSSSSFFSPPMYYESQRFQNLEESTSSEKQSFDEVKGFLNWMEIENGNPSSLCTTEETEGSSPSMTTREASIDVSSVEKPLVFPREDMELDYELSIPHLLNACGEAMESQNTHLVEVILRRLEEKACPRGSAAQRLVYYLIQSLDEDFDYLMQEARKNYEAAFRAFYQIFPYGRFAHFVANSSILEAVPEDAEIIRIVDFDMGEGVQWPPLIEALGNQHRGVRQIQIVSVKIHDFNSMPSFQNFEKTKERLCEHASSSGVQLEVGEVDMEGLVSEMKKMENCGRREMLAFNCMVGLPHMGRHRSSRHVEEFLKIAQESIGLRNWNGFRNNGVITFGDGQTMSDYRGFGSFFEAQLGRATALLESMEGQISSHLKEARIAMECLFVAPYVSSLACFENPEERDWRGMLPPKIGLDAWKMSRDTVAEAKELVREGDSLYWIGTEGEIENQVVLCFLGTPLVRVSTWS
ncbi:Nodulation-signaling pathway 2 protein [Actinidia chinensis var. chinensis]|uniref:Nodulation-signaling pathway 2 protein n=1 Tax=Actinidia chinensis var. chinensis TaxID=1590841 RepID=A0A2R6PPY4_ACTCC|nr:Nodulation-signaling pathway 2 protein [Actinidia chinensis var. chinensis]